MKTVVILAFNPGNAGMYSVDLAARSMFNGDPNVGFFVAQKGPRGGPRIYGINLRRLTVDAVRQAERIIYWGDFLNNPLYGRADFSKRDVDLGYSVNASDAFRRWRALFLLDAPELQSSQADFLSFGGNFMNFAKALNAELNEVRYRELLGRFREIRPRDTRSYAELRSLAPNHVVLAPGMDCAFLLDQPRPRFRRARYFVHLFRRSEISESDAIISDVARATGLEPIPIIHWLRLAAVNLNGFPFVLRSHLFFRMLEMIGEAAFVLTDVYHLSVNAIRCGTRTICVGRDGDQDTTVSDLKKRVLLEDLNILEDYLEVGPETTASEIAAMVHFRLKEAEYFHDRLPIIDRMVQSFREEVEATINPSKML